MIRTLIADDNLIYAKNIINDICSKFPDIKIDYIATDGQETFETVSRNILDLILLDLRMPKLNGIEVLKKLKNLDNIQFPHVVIISGDNAYLSQIKNKYQEYNICCIIEKTDSQNIVYSKIEQVINKIQFENNFFSIKSKIMNELCGMGYNFKHKGTRYILEAILYIYQNNNFDLLNNLEDNVYKFIAYKYSKSTPNIKTNIIKATNLIDSTSLYIKPTPKYVISTILINISNYSR